MHFCFASAKAYTSMVFVSPAGAISQDQAKAKAKTWSHRSRFVSGTSPNARKAFMGLLLVVLSHSLFYGIDTTFSYPVQNHCCRNSGPGSAGTSQTHGFSPTRYPCWGPERPLGQRMLTWDDLKHQVRQEGENSATCMLLSWL